MTVEIDLRPGNAQRVTFLADSRGGKTVLMQSLLAADGIESVVVFDSKHRDDEWFPFCATFDYVVTRNWRDILTHPRVLYRVDSRALQDVTGWRKPGSTGYEWTQALAAVMQRGPTLTVYDEGMHTLPSRNPHPEARRMSTQGAGLGIGMFIGTQAPLFVDTVALAQSEHLFAFRQAHPGYRVHVRDQRGIDAEALAKLGKYEFAYHEKGAAEWVKFAPIAPLRFTTKRGPANGQNPSA